MIGNGFQGQSHNACELSNAGRSQLFFFFLSSYRNHKTRTCIISRKVCKTHPSYMFQLNSFLFGQNSFWVLACFACLEKSAVFLFFLCLVLWNIQSVMKLASIRPIFCRGINGWEWNSAACQMLTVWRTQFQRNLTLTSKTIYGLLILILRMFEYYRIA